MAKTVAGDLLSASYQTLTENVVINHQKVMDAFLKSNLDPRDMEGSIRRILPRLTVMAQMSARDYALVSQNFLTAFTEAEGLGTLDVTIADVRASFDPVYFQQRMIGASDFAFKNKMKKIAPPVSQLEVDRVFTQIVSNVSKDYSTHVLRPGRDGVTKVAGQSALYVSWARNPNSGACDFCLMLATRDNYRSKSSAGFEAHRSCKCSAEPVTNDWLPSVKNEEAYDRWLRKQDALNEDGDYANTPARLAAKKAEKEKIKSKPAGEKITASDARSILLG